MIDVAPAHLRIILDILQAHVPACEVRAFGSRYRGTAREHSDLDLAVVCERKLALAEFGRLREAFENSTLPFRVDVLDWHAISPEFRQVIEQGCEVIQERGKGASSEWEFVSLGEIATLNYGKSLTARKRKGGNVPVYSSSGLIGWHNEALVDEEGIIIGRKGTVGSVYYSDQPFFCIDTAYFIKKSELSCDIVYLYYLLKTLGLEHLNEDSAVPGLNRDTAYSQEFILPPPPTQRRIAAILSALDDKIELNRQMNATLEAIAQAIFKEWFVDFNFLGATGEMVESELGPIPKGWMVGKIKELGKIICGKTPSKANSDFFDGCIPFVKIPDMHGSVFVTKTKDSLTEKGALSQKNKFIPAHSILVSCIATVGLVSITSERSQTNQQINSIIPKDGFLSFYLYFYMRGLSNELKELGSGGSATLNVNTTTFSNINSLIPSNDILTIFDEEVRPIFQKILSNIQESTTLSQTRDALLPKLMNGEIAV